MSIIKTETNVPTLKINYLTQEMYDNALENDQINDNELYLTPSKGGSGHTELTQAQYDALPQATKENGDVYFITDGSPLPSSLVNMFYPIGSYYETSDTSFNPNVSWGGTWQLETEGQVHISAGANYTVAGALTNTTDGGEETHQLTVDELASHSHTFSYAEYGRGTGSSTTSALQYTGSTKTTNSTGSGDPHNNMQPYIVVNRWHRTA